MKRCTIYSVKVGIVYLLPFEEKRVNELYASKVKEILSSKVH